MVALALQNVIFGKFESAQSPATLIDKAKRGHLDSFNELVLTYQDAVYQQAYWILGDEDAAEDATQEAFLRAYRNISSFKEGPFRPWILRIATNYCYDQLRSQKRHATISLEPYDEYDQEITDASWLIDQGASVEEQIEQADSHARILKAIQSLAPEYRSAIILVDIQGLDYKEAASAVNVPLGTLKSRISRGRLLLQEYLRPIHKTALQ